MKKSITALFTSFLISIFLSAAFAATAPSVVEIKMKSLSFEPKVLQITQGQNVVWDNVALTDHTATASTFDTGLVHPGKKSKKVAFKNAGTFTYHCSIHGVTMSGKINVQPKSTP